MPQENSLISEGDLIDGLRHCDDLDEAHVAGARHLVQGPGHAPDAPVFPVKSHALVHAPRVIQGPVLLQDVVIPEHEMVIITVKLCNK